MALNPYFSNRAIPSEHNLYDSLIAEAIQIRGTEVYYLPRTLRKEDKIFGEDTLSAFNTAIPIEMLMETIKGPEGDGDIISKFGLEIRDQTTFSVSKRRWEEVVGSTNLTTLPNRPCEGDLIYLRIADYQKELYQITFLEHEDPFYQLEEVFMYRLKCEMFSFSNESFNTGIPEIDSLNDKTAFNALYYSINTETNDQILLESGGVLIQDDWDMENSNREYATNQIFRDAAAPLTVTPVNPFGFS